jgi:hypothetical protein
VVALVPTPEGRRRGPVVWPHFLRMVIWIVPDFSLDRYHDRLAALDELIRRDGPFVANPTRFLIEATKPS